MRSDDKNRSGDQAGADQIMRRGEGRCLVDLPGLGASLSWRTTLGEGPFADEHGGVKRMRPHERDPEASEAPDGVVGGPKPVPGHPDYRAWPDGRYECCRNQAGVIRSGRWHPRKHVPRPTAGGRCLYYKFLRRDTDRFEEIKAVELVMELFGRPRPADRDVGGVRVPIDPHGLIVVIRSAGERGLPKQLDCDMGDPANLHIDRLDWGYKQPRSPTRPARRR